MGMSLYPKQGGPFFNHWLGFATVWWLEKGSKTTPQMVEKFIVMNLMVVRCLPPVELLGSGCLGTTGLTGLTTSTFHGVPC